METSGKSFAQSMETRRESIQLEILMESPDGQTATWTLGRSKADPAGPYLSSLGAIAESDGTMAGEPLLVRMATTRCPAGWSPFEKERTQMLRTLAAEALGSDAGKLPEAEPAGQGLQVSVIMRPCGRLVLVLGTRGTGEVEALRAALGPPSMRVLRRVDDPQGPRLVLEEPPAADAKGKRTIGGGKRLTASEPLHGHGHVAWDLLLVQTWVDCVITTPIPGERWPQVLAYELCESRGYSERLRQRWEWTTGAE